MPWQAAQVAARVAPFSGSPQVVSARISLALWVTSGADSTGASSSSGTVVDWA